MWRGLRRELIMKNPTQKTFTNLTCACCGGSAGAFKQHPNQDTGYGICASCVSRRKGRGTCADEIADLFGTAGVNYEQPMHSLYGRRYSVVAEFLATDIGMAQANKFMLANEGASLLAEENGRLILAHKNDKGVV